jgi:hypothetical protein
MAGSHLIATLIDGNLLWCRYCIPLDEHHRAITKAEERFFSECDTNNGTFVISVSPKSGDWLRICFSSRDCGVYEIRCTVGWCIWATQKVWIKTEGVLGQGTRTCKGNIRQCENLGSTMWNPIPTQGLCMFGWWVDLWCLLHRVIPCMLEMGKDSADCGPLLECTTSALGEEAMQMLLISTQRTNMALCIKRAVKK